MSLGEGKRGCHAFEGGHAWFHYLGLGFVRLGKGEKPPPSLMLVLAMNIVVHQTRLWVSRGRGEAPPIGRRRIEGGAAPL